MSIPDLFRCPISLDLFADPVTLSTGQTYDRPFIEKWLADGNLTCPVTMQRLEDTTLVPNHTLQHLIDQWLLAGHKSTGSGQFFSLQSSETNLGKKLESLRKIRTLSVVSDTGQAYLIQSGLFPILLQLLLQSPSIVDEEDDIVELALECITSLLPLADLDSLNLFRSEPNLDRLLVLLERGTVSVQTGICCLIESIASSATTRELCLSLGRSHRLLQALVVLLHETSDASVIAVSGICTLEANRENVVEAGGIGGLIAYLSKSNPQNSLRALATLEVLLQLESGTKDALKKNLRMIDILVKNVFRVSPDHRGSEHAVGSLLAVCGGSVRARAEAVDSGAVMQLLLLIQSQCGAEVKTKARALLKLLRFSWA